MTYLEALEEARSALEVRRRWYVRRAARFGGNPRRAIRLADAIAKLDELIAAARETGL